MFGFTSLSVRISSLGIFSSISKSSYVSYNQESRYFSIVLPFQLSHQSGQLLLVGLGWVQETSFIADSTCHTSPAVVDSFVIAPSVGLSDKVFIAHGLVISVCIAHHFALGVVTIVCFIVHSGVIIGVASGV